FAFSGSVRYAFVPSARSTIVPLAGGASASFNLCNFTKSSSERPPNGVVAGFTGVEGSGFLPSCANSADPTTAKPQSDTTTSDRLFQRLMILPPRTDDGTRAGLPDDDGGRCGRGRVSITMGRVRSRRLRGECMTRRSRRFVVGGFAAI